MTISTKQKDIVIAVEYLKRSTKKRSGLENQAAVRHQVLRDIFQTTNRGRDFVVTPPLTEGSGSVQGDS